jgi:hypothetical protein
MLPRKVVTPRCSRCRLNRSLNESNFGDMRSAAYRMRRAVCGEGLCSLFVQRERARMTSKVVLSQLVIRYHAAPRMNLDSTPTESRASAYHETSRGARVLAGSGQPFCLPVCTSHTVDMLVDNIVRAHVWTSIYVSITSC